MRNLGAILGAAGFSLADAVQVQVFLADLADFEQFNREYGSFFKAIQPPARVTVQVARLPKDARVEIALIACKAANQSP